MARLLLSQHSQQVLPDLQRAAENGFSTHNELIAAGQADRNRPRDWYHLHTYIRTYILHTRLLLLRLRHIQVVVIVGDNATHISFKVGTQLLMHSIHTCIHTYIDMPRQYQPRLIEITVIVIL